MSHCIRKVLGSNPHLQQACQPHGPHRCLALKSQMASTCTRCSAFCIYEFCMLLGLNGDYVLKTASTSWFCNGEVRCSLWGTASIVKYHLVELRLRRVLNYIRRAASNVQNLTNFKFQMHVKERLMYNCFILQLGPNKLEMCLFQIRPILVCACGKIQERECILCWSLK
jgi:hypothetical protein